MTVNRTKFVIDSSNMHFSQLLFHFTLVTTIELISISLTAALYCQRDKNIFYSVSRFSYCLSPGTYVGYVRNNMEVQRFKKQSYRLWRTFYKNKYIQHFRVYSYTPHRTKCRFDTFFPFLYNTHLNLNKENP